MEFMNKPEEKEITVEDIVREYKMLKDAKQVADRLCMKVTEVKKIIKNLGL